MTMQILVLYYSQHGTTKFMAQEIAKGIESVEPCEALLRTVPEVSADYEALSPQIPETGDIYVTLNDLKNCSGLALGSPTRFGNMAAALKYFLDSTSNIWLSGQLIDKPATVFTSTSSLHGGQESTLISMMLPLLHQGMIISGIPYSVAEISSTQTGGSPYGSTHWSKGNTQLTLSTEEKLICQAQGKRLAKLCVQLNAAH
ncbi:MAG: NAD(P)H-quinone oxidoreductase [Gammaproteobacteria bacterium CG22_combo_CG10-13_8_21_14_all_40_8]|nr:MAG: NAD(P)H-quinone oxidoreductase [Gammaproteobacteria bacterium CG22_combo_CG10-13_8_21_14_all_40_8]